MVIPFTSSSKFDFQATHTHALVHITNFFVHGIPNLSQKATGQEDKMSEESLLELLITAKMSILFNFYLGKA